MVQPPAPWPQPPQYSDTLSALVASGDLSQVRGYFDRVFWEGRKERPDWQHLKIALLRDDRPMLKLLGAWGAHPSGDDLKKFRALAKEKYPAYLRTLRSAGLRPSETETPRENIGQTAPEITRAEIESRAYAIYVKNRIQGRDVENWLQAERELAAEKKAALEKTSPRDEALMRDTELRMNKAAMPKAPRP